ncbi:hypothetical protein EDD29_1039 [Actinocorallia herbida]|uniref:Uncharacterized protein n=2 Tax=Actinocorallia herbida TaxID=58109 RepID=A0A3N1CQF1_9ACTN|nr:hypothetical protein EDD29_1039 [Actinocorallia herbida]
MATDPYETRSDTPLPGKAAPGQGGGTAPEGQDSDKTVPVPLPSPPPPPETPAEPPAPPETVFDVQQTVADSVKAPQNEAPPATFFDVPVAGSPRPSQEPGQPGGQYVLPPDSPYAQPTGRPAYGTQFQQPQQPQHQPPPPAPQQGQSLYETRQDAPQAPPAPPQPPQAHAPQPQYPPAPLPQAYPPGPPYPQPPYPAPEQAAPARPVPASWHRQHYAVGLFLIVYSLLTLVLGQVGFGDRKEELAEYLSEGIAGPAYIAVKAVQVLLLVATVEALRRRRSVLFLPVLAVWTASFAVLAVLDVVSGAYGTLLEHALYAVAFGIALFLSYALSVKAGTSAQAAAAVPVPAGPGGPPPQQPSPQSLSRTQEFALNTLNRWQR